MSSLAKALCVAILVGTAGQAAAVDNGGPIDRALVAIKANPTATRQRCRPLGTKSAQASRSVCRRAPDEISGGQRDAERAEANDEARPPTSKELA
jgi:hypothetical protein